MGELFNITILQASLRLTTPILLAALGGLYTTKAGITNIALEGMMLLGAFAAVVGSYFLQNAWLGLLLAILTGGFLGYILGLLSIKLKANHIVSGIAINIVASGLSIYLLRVFFGTRGSFQSPDIPGIPNWRIPLLNRVPILGQLIGTANPIFYFSLIMVGISVFVLYHTAFGLRLRAVGEGENAAASVGINVPFVRYFATTLSGILCGMAGAYLSIGHLTLFTEGMSSGRGWLGLSAMVFGNQMPLGTFFASWAFGFADALQMRLQGMGVPSQFVQMFPYFLVLITLVRIGMSRNKEAGVNKRLLED